MKKIIILSVLTLTLSLQSYGQTKPDTNRYKNASLSIDERVEALLPLLSLEEKSSPNAYFSCQYRRRC